MSQQFVLGFDTSTTLYNGQRVHLSSTVSLGLTTSIFYAYLINSTSIGLYYDLELRRPVPASEIRTNVYVTAFEVSSISIQIVSNIGVSYGITWINNTSILTNWNTSSNLVTWLNAVSSTSTWINNI